MTTAPPGWYPDPTPPPGVPPLPRWWDGVRWTEHYGSTVAAGQPAASTPDGQPLAGWGERLGALVLDSLILAPATFLLGLPFLVPIFRGFVDQMNDFIGEAEQGGNSPPPVFEYPDNFFWLMLGWAIVTIVVQLTYEVGFLRWKQATPGKLALGLRVRLRERPGPLDWRTCFLRSVMKNAGSFVGWLPFVGGLIAAGWMVNFLWPLWDEKKQALHEKPAATNVVKIR